MSELPVDMLSKIASYYMGEPKYMRLKHNKMFRQIQKKFKINYEITRRPEYFLNSYRMEYEITGQRLSTSIITYQVDRIYDFVKFVEQSKTHQWYSTMTLEIRISHYRASNGIGVSDWETFIEYLPCQSPTSIVNILHSLSIRFELTFDRYLRWFTEDEHNRKFKINNIHIRLEQEKGSNDEEGSESEYDED